MKKNEIKQDPVRDFILDIISKTKERWKSAILFIAGAVVIVPLMLNFYSKDSNPDYLDCLVSDASKDIVSLNDYCNSNSVLEALSANKEASLSSSEGLFVFIKDLQGMALDEKLLKIKTTDFSKIKNRLIKAKFYEFFADILMDSGQASESQENYLKALSLSDSDFYSAILKFKISQVLFSKQDFEEAHRYADEALKYNFEDPSIIKKIEILKGRTLQIMSRF